MKIIRKKFESIYEEAWKLHHQNSQIDANSEEEDYLNDETSEGFEEHEEISY